MLRLLPDTGGCKSMSDLRKVFAKGRAFIPFIMAGDPSIEVTQKLVLAMEKAGADLIEIGIPFSDPIGEGPAIQEASIRALSGGVNVDKILSAMESIKESHDLPIAFMVYANTVFAYGSYEFMRRCREAGVQALIVPDLPYEEKGELLPYCSAHGITLISMVAPTSRDRMNLIAKEAEGFLYCVSSMGVTGVRERIGDEAREMVRDVRTVTDIPVAVGFGISKPDQAREIASFADGVIVGSAIVEIMGTYGEGCVPYVLEYVHVMKDAIAYI